MIEPQKAKAQIGLWTFLFLLALASLHLSMTRILQVDEAQQVFQAGILARGEAALYYTHAPLFHMGPMAWIARHTGASENIFLWNRLLFLGVFWLNLVLLARLGAGTWRGLAFPGWLLAAATLAPLWDYGLEIRHDNLLLTGLLALWALGRSRRWPPLGAFAAMGALSVLLQACVFKSLLYWVPLTALFLVFPATPPKGGRLRLAGAFLAGVGVALLCVRGAYALTGGWQAHLQGFMGGLGSPATVVRFSPLATLERLLHQTPLLLSLTLAALLVCWQNGRKRDQAFRFWDGLLPEAILLAIVTLAFLANPTPFPYNLVLLVPFMLLTTAALWRQGRVFPSGPLLIGLLVFGHGLPFLAATVRHWEHNMDRQVLLMTTAENLTDPASDRVFDGVGLVPSRASIGFNWWIHSFTLHRFNEGTPPLLKRLLTEHPPSVILTSYRTDWLSPENIAFIRSHYVALADDFLVLGQPFSAGGGSFTCLHQGRYEVRAQDPAQPGLRVDGLSYPSPSVLFLPQGTHTLGSESPAQVVWVGPKAAEPPTLPPGSHRGLFINWY